MEDLKVLKLPYNEDYIQNRIDRFYEEFLSHEQPTESIEQILCTIHDYLLLCDHGQSNELSQSIINLRQSIYWINTWSSDEFDLS